MMSHPILATDYGPGFAWLYCIPIWGLALVVCAISAATNSRRTLSVAGGVIALIMIVTTLMGVSHTDDMGVAMVGDLIASMGIDSLEFVLHMRPNKIS